jgi:hypothetical protein
MKQSRIVKIILGIILGIMVAILLFIIFHNIWKKEVEGFEEKEYKCYNWWPTTFTEGCDKGIVDGLIKPLTVGTKAKKINIYSVFEANKETPEKGKPNELAIQLSGESYCKETENYDINLVMEKEDLEKRIITVPWGYSDLCSKNTPEKTKEILEGLTKKRKMEGNKKSKFCIFVVSNPSNPVRNRFFEKLSEYKSVDSYGKYANNMPNEEYTFDKIEKYKFMICFENKAKDEYFTEKLMNAYLGGAIPIYWGCTNIKDYVNGEAMQLLESEEKMDELIERIKELDKNEEKYREAYETIFFKDGKIPDTFNMEIIKSKIESLS